MPETQEKAREVAGEAQDRAREAAGQARGRVSQEVDRRSTQAGEQVSARSVADELRLLNIASGVGLVVVNALLAQRNHSRPPLKRALFRRS
jgi:hypothetical protein